MEYVIALAKVILIALGFFLLGACASMPQKDLTGVFMRDCSQICFDGRAYDEEKTACGCSVYFGTNHVNR